METQSTRLKQNEYVSITYFAESVVQLRNRLIHRYSKLDSNRISERELGNQDHLDSPSQAIVSPYQLGTKYRLGGDQIQKIILMSYQCSLVKVEGDYPSARILVGDWPTVNGRIFEFSNPLPLTTTAVLRELLSAASNNCAIQISELNGQLAAKRCILHTNPLSSIASQVASHFDGFYGCVIGIRGPGVIDFYERPISFRYTRGKVVKQRSIVNIPFVRNWLAEVKSQILYDNPELNSWSPKYSGEVSHDYGDIRYDLSGVWQLLLRSIANIGHGGCIAVLQDPSSADLSIRYQSHDTSFREAIRNNFINIKSIAECRRLMQHFFLCESASSFSPDDSQVAGNHLAGLEGIGLDSKGPSHLYKHIESLAHLSKIDGCIIFDKQMNLHGFGGIIHADQKQVSSVRIVINNIETENSESEFLSLKGTRHRSAFSLAKQNESSLIFVISQDGQVSCYHRAQNTMFISENSW